MGAGGAPTVVRRWSGGGPVVGAGGGPVGAGGGPVVSKYLSIFETKTLNAKKKKLHICKVFEKKKSFFRKKIFATGLVFERFLAPRSRFFEKVNEVSSYKYTNYCENVRTLVDQSFIKVGWCGYSRYIIERLGDRFQFMRKHRDTLTHNLRHLKSHEDFISSEALDSEVPILPNSGR
ncbi:hypothetical protein LXL04_002429 [Taraxacum kok-saghyz]